MTEALQGLLRDYPIGVRSQYSSALILLRISRDLPPFFVLRLIGDLPG